MDALKAAVAAGCDAVYLGMQIFSARAFAGNFSHEELQKAVDANDVEGMKTKMEALTNAFYPISTRIYQEAQAAQQAAGGQGFDPNNMGGFNAGGSNSAPNDGTVDADYEVVDD